MFEALSNWAAGVITAIASHALPPNASPRARNSVLLGASQDQAYFAKRRGLTTMNATPITGSSAILAEIDFRRASGTTLTPYHLVISANGRFDKLLDDGTTAAADSFTASPFTANATKPDWTIANNLLFIVKGGDKKKFDGTTVSNFGIAAPAAAPTLADSGVAGIPSGTYEGALVYYNSNTGQRSSRSASASITVTAKQIDFSWTAPPDAQVTHVIPVIRNTSNQPNFYEIPTPVAIGTTTYRFNLDTTTLITLAPSTLENNPPPAGVTQVELHNERLFVTDGALLYYSKQGSYESFDPNAYEAVGKNDGQLIVGIHSAHGVLMIFKQRSTYLLIGQDPADWRIEVLDAGVGATAHLSILTVNGVTYWWSLQSVVAWAGTGRVQALAGPLIGPSVTSSLLNYAAFDQVVAAADLQNKRLLFAAPEPGSTRNTIIFPFNYQLGVWDSDGWDPMDASALSTVYDSTDTPFVYLGGYQGQIFQFDDSSGNDGVPSLNVAGTVTAATSTTLSDSTANWPTTGGKLIERYVFAIDPSETHVQRRRITGNTATQLTVDPAWSSTPNTQWTYAIGGPDFQLDTRWNFADAPFVKKRFMHFHVIGGSQNSSIPITVDFFLDFNNASTNPDTKLALTITGIGAKWGPGGAKWGQAQWGGQVKPSPQRYRIGKTGFGWRARIRNRNPNQDVQIFMVGVSSELLSTKLG
jgi:hypothetical protein